MKVWNIIFLFPSAPSSITSLLSSSSSVLWSELYSDAFQEGDLISFNLMELMTFAEGKGRVSFIFLLLLGYSNSILRSFRSTFLGSCGRAERWAYSLEVMGSISESVHLISSAVSGSWNDNNSDISDSLRLLGWNDSGV